MAFACAWDTIDRAEASVAVLLTACTLNSQVIASVCLSSWSHRHCRTTSWPCMQHNSWHSPLVVQQTTVANYNTRKVICNQSRQPASSVYSHTAQLIRMARAVWCQHKQTLAYLSQQLSAIYQVPEQHHCCKCQLRRCENQRWVQCSPEHQHQCHRALHNHGCGVYAGSPPKF